MWSVYRLDCAKFTDRNVGELARGSISRAIRARFTWRAVFSSDYKGHGSLSLEWITYSNINLWVIKWTNPFRIFNSVLFTSICEVISITNIPLRLDSDGSFVNWYLSPKQWLFVMQTQVIRLRAVETWRDEGGGKQPTRTSPSMCQPIESRSAKISGVFLWEKHRLLLKIGCKQIGENVLKPVSQLYLSTAALLT